MGRLALTFASALILLQACAPKEAEFRRDWAVMGTTAQCRIFTEDDDLARRGFQVVDAALDSVIETMNTWDPNSEISRLNRAPADSTLVLSPWLSDCLHLAVVLNKRTGGAFDATAEPLMRLWGFYRREGRLPSDTEIAAARESMGRFYLDNAWGKLTKKSGSTAFDLGGLAKGYAVKQCEKGLRELGVANALVDLGGNMACLGAPPGKEAWTVGVRDPLDREKVFATLQLHDLSVATSGSYERFVEIDGRRFGHIMNPASGRPAEGLLSATAVTSDAALADGLSTSLFVAGPEGAREMLARAFPTADAVLVCPGEDGGKPRVWVSPGLRDRFALLPEYEGRYLIVSD